MVWRKDVADLIGQYEHPEALLRSALGHLIWIKWLDEAGLLGPVRHWQREGGAASTRKVDKLRTIDYVFYRRDFSSPARV
jgi:hypothetical protein